MGIVGGGPAGSLFAFFLLRFADQLDPALEVDIYEPRDLARPGPDGCNMCGGIVSEDLVQILALEGINRPTSVVQRGIDAYELRTPVGRVGSRLRPASRGSPRSIEAAGRKTSASSPGEAGQPSPRAHARPRANVIRRRVKDAGRSGGRPELGHDRQAKRYDRVVGASGVNSGAWRLYDALGLRAARPATVRAYISERLGEEAIAHAFGSTIQLVRRHERRPRRLRRRLAGQPARRGRACPRRPPPPLDHRRS